MQPVRAGKRRRVHNLALCLLGEREREGTAEQKDIDYLVDNNRGTTARAFRSRHQIVRDLPNVPGKKKKRGSAVCMYHR